VGESEVERQWRHGSTFFIGAVVAAATGFALLVFSGAALLFSAKISILAFIVVTAWGLILWRAGSRLSRAMAAGVTIPTVGLLILFVPAWATHLDHDRRLDRFVDELCSVDIGRRGSVVECGGSISNTGNGNSCEYSVWARVTGDVDQRLFRRSYEGAYPEARGVEGPTFEETDDGFMVTVSQGWMPDEGDLRCQ